MNLYQGMVFQKRDNNGLHQMNVERACRQGDIYYRCYNRKNGCRNLFQEDGGDGVKVTLLLGQADKSLAISLIDAGGNDDKTSGVGGGSE